MAKNIEMNYLTGSGYEVLYPKTISEQIIYGDETLDQFLSDSDFVTVDNLVELGLTTYFEAYTWQQIDEALAAGNTNLFTVGDVKKIELSGTVGSMTFQSTPAYATIIGINHNASREGNNRLHIQLSLDNSNTICLGAEQMNTTATNVGGWGSSYIRNTICAGLLNCLPADMRNVVKNTTKYTSAGNRSTSIVSTSDKIFLLSEFEVFGLIQNSVSGEQNYQQRYAWYSNHTASKKNELTSPVTWWERSPSQSYSTAFCSVSNSGGTNYGNATYSFSIAPCLCI